MDDLQKAQRPAGTGRHEGADLGGNQHRNSTPITGAMPRNFRDRIDAATAFAESLDALSEPNLLGWATAHCPFCNARHALRAQLRGNRGAWHCRACKDQGDIIKFHQRLTGLDFKGAVRGLVELTKQGRNKTELALLRNLYAGGAHVD